MNPEHLKPEDVRRAEALVGQIRGVSSCRIQTDDAGGITEIHVVARSGKPPKLLARDVESLLKAEMDLDVDYKKIGVVVVDADRQEDEPAEGAVEEFDILEFASRFAFVTVHVATSRDGMRAEVELSRDSAAAFGASQTDNLSTPPWTVVAEATLRAISEFLDASTRLCLSGVLKVPLNGADAIVAQVDVIAPRCTKSLVGCALVSGNENQSAVFATLDAVNRVIGKLDFKSSIEYKIQ
jgi:hypothetical protein